ncbi:hypothetical protein ACFFKU_04475 [Kineococcus gynurae]|uniref:Uncharacterized protein n=1 Tax=Kineococcus gynurae TaxID=452979 RepID=A0ABV5LRF8_9ACTN
MTKAALEALWGDELPPTADPVRDVLADAIAVDDQAGREGDLVVQGDQLSLTVLVTLLHRAGSSPPDDRDARSPGRGPVRDGALDLVDLLPLDLRERVRRRLLGTASAGPRNG